MIWVLRHRHLREWRFAALVVASVVLIGLHLAAGLERLGPEGSGWRRIDLETLQRRMEAGELSDREALWYHPTRPEERVPGGGTR
jgi:hypothetical protein